MPMVAGREFQWQMTMLVAMVVSMAVSMVVASGYGGCKWWGVKKETNRT